METLMANRKLIAGNWKMNGTLLSLAQISEMKKGYDAALRARLDLLVCPPATLLHAASVICVGSGIATGAQDCHAKASGAFTGDLSAAMLADAGATAIIVGHSERRTLHGETDADVAAKAAAATAERLMPVICVGETRAEREAGKAGAVVRRQVKRSIPDNADPARLVIAYEPVWAIGTGLTPTSADIVDMHAFIRARVRDGVRILYGGSVKPSNAEEILSISNVNGALVGGASLKADDFFAIIQVAR
jgi:triosephosphate isomerase